MMIQFSLICAEKHRFDSWFQSSAAYDSLYAAGMVTCAICGSSKVEKALMAPRVLDSGAKERHVQGPAARHAPLSTPQTAAEQALAELRRKVEANSEYVGMNFVQEARDMHIGLIPDRSIYGEARPEEAAKLIEDGVPVAPLPFMPSRKNN